MSHPYTQDVFRQKYACADIDQLSCMSQTKACRSQASVLAGSMFVVAIYNRTAADKENSLYLLACVNVRAGSGRGRIRGRGRVTMEKVFGLSSMPASTQPG